jgi:hypothetical protein
VFLDTDPGVNQIQLNAPGPRDDQWAESVKRFERYDRFVTYAENIGRADCLVPLLGKSWITTRMPIVRSLWSDVPPAMGGEPWTTVMTWNNFSAPLVHEGKEYGSKGVEFAKFSSLPQTTSRKLKIAVGGNEAPREKLIGDGWAVVDAPMMTLTPGDYRAFIAASRGEFSTRECLCRDEDRVVHCRTACYLAAGRPRSCRTQDFRKRSRWGKAARVRYAGTGERCNRDG